MSARLPYFTSAATVLNSVQPQLHTNGQTMFQPQAAAAVQPVQAAVQQVTPQPAQASGSGQVAASQAAPTLAQATSASTTVSQSNISVAALQTAGLSLNPAIVSMCVIRHDTCDISQFNSTVVVIFSEQISAASLGAQPQFLSSLTSTPIITSAMSNMAGITSQIITNAQGQVCASTTFPVFVL